MKLTEHVTKPQFVFLFLFLALERILQGQLILLHIWYGESVFSNPSYCSQSKFLEYICGWFCNLQFHS